MLNAAIIGFGGIAQAHRQGYEVLEKASACVKKDFHFIQCLPRALSHLC